MKQQSELQTIIELMSRWLSQVRLNTALTFYDINKISEDFSCKLLNLIFDYELVNLNLKQANFPGIDLGDKTKGMVAFQVTSRIDGEKIRETLRMFVGRKYNNIFVNGIKFFILNQDTVKFGNQNPENIYYEFNKQKDILTDKDIIKEIQYIYNKNSDKFNAIKQLFAFEFGDGTSVINSDASPFQSKLEPDVLDIQKELAGTVICIRETVENNYTIHQRDTLSPSIQKAMNEEASKGFSLPQGSLAGRLFDIYLKEISVYASMIRECSLSLINNSSMRFSSFEFIELFKELLIAHNKKIKNYHNRQVTDLFTHGSSTHAETMVDHFSKQADVETKLRCKELLASLKIYNLSTCAEMDFQPWEPIIKEKPKPHTFVEDDSA